MKPLVITRHEAFVAWLRAQGIIDDDAEVIPHCDDPAVLRGRVVIGPCPLHLAAEAQSIVHIPLRLAPADRGRELSLDELSAAAGQPVEYQVLEGGSYLRERQDLADARRISPGAQSPMAAIDAAFAAWAEAHGLVEADFAPEGLPTTEDAAEIVRLGRLPPPPGGKIVMAGLLRGRPYVRAEIRLRTCSSSRSFHARETMTASCRIDRQAQIAIAADADGMELTVGTRVEGGEGEDYDAGTVLEVGPDGVTVGWDSGVRTTQDGHLLNRVR